MLKEIEVSPSDIPSPPDMRRSGNAREAAKPKAAAKEKRSDGKRGIQPSAPKLPATAEKGTTQPMVVGAASSSASTSSLYHVPGGGVFESTSDNKHPDGPAPEGWVVAQCRSATTDQVQPKVYYYNPSTKQSSHTLAGVRRWDPSTRKKPAPTAAPTAAPTRRSIRAGDALGTLAMSSTTSTVVDCFQPCKSCSSPAAAGNYGFCVGHRCASACSGCGVLPVSAVARVCTALSVLSGACLAS